MDQEERRTDGHGDGGLTKTISISSCKRHGSLAGKRSIGRGGSLDTSSPIIVFTDGAAKGNPGPGGWGAIVVTPDRHVTELGGGSPHTTNNRMELSGAIATLQHVATQPGRVVI